MYKRQIYASVASTGLPNIDGARVVVPCELKLPAWERYLSVDPNAGNLYDLLCYGFPMGYLGPASDSLHFSNHATSVNFPSQVEAFLVKEKSCSAMYGPYTATPFHPWAHISPLMSKAKATPDERRIITDLSYGDHLSINGYIKRNTSLGVTRGRYSS